MGISVLKIGGGISCTAPWGIPIFRVNSLTSHLFDSQMIANQLSIRMKSLILLAYMRFQINDTLK